MIIRARNLQDKSKVGKQSPYVVLRYGQDKKRTSSKKKGGQHPEFDEEFRFKIYEDVEDIVERQQLVNVHGGDTPQTMGNGLGGEGSGSSLGRATADPSLPPIPGEMRMPTKKAMIVQIFADDSKEPKMVGETVVDLTTVLKKGEHDGEHRDAVFGLNTILPSLPPLSPYMPSLGMIILC